MADSTPVLDSRVAADVAAELTALAPAYTPELSNASGGVSGALLQVLGRYAQAIIERLNQAPDKNKLAFLDQMGISLLPPQAAKAPVVFQSIPNTGDSTVAAQSSVGAAGPDPSSPIVFQTMQAIALASASLAGVLAVAPDLDSYADYSTAATAIKPFTLFQSLQPIRHEIYFAHDTVLRLAGQSTVTLTFDLKTDGANALNIQWEFWNGEIWQQFDPTDLTNGLTRSGRVLLAAGCADAETTQVNGVTAYWVRGAVMSPISPDPTVAVADVNTIRVQSTIARPLPAGGGGLLPDTAYSNGVQVDTTKTFFPLGQTPDGNSAFYFTNDEVFSKPGAAVHISVAPQQTPQAQADKLAQQYVAAQALALEIKVASAVGSAAELAVAELAAIIQLWDDPIPNPLLPPLETQLAAATAAIHAIAAPADFDNARIQLALVPPLLDPLQSQPSLAGVKQPASLGQCCADLAAAIEDLGSLANLIAGDQTVPLLSATHDTGFLLSEIANAALGNNSDDTYTAYLKAYNEIGDASDIAALAQPAKDLVADVNSALNGNPFLAWTAYFSLVRDAVERVSAVLAELSILAKAQGSGTVEANPPSLDPAQLIWEYWNGRAWATLIAPSSNDVANFGSSGTLSFTNPHNFGTCTVAGTTARWARVRLASGSFNTLRYVTWRDQVTDSVTAMALLQPHPPSIGGFYLGYNYTSPTVAAQHCFALNDFQWNNYTQDAHFGGSPFEPLRPTADRTPTIYFGFNKPLPAGVVGVYLDIVLHRNQASGPDLNWQYWNGSSWQNLGVQDDSKALALPGVVSVAWPGAPSKPLARFGTSLTWLRAALKSDVAPLKSRINGAYLNAVWAQNLQTVQNEALGSSNGQPGQTFFLKQTPVLGDPSIQVCELQGDRAATELASFTADLLASGLTQSDIRVVNDAITGAVTQVWVQWRVRPNLLLSGGGAREYTIERDTGMVLFGDNQDGMIPPAGDDNIVALQYTYGGGTAGNVPVGAITQLLSGVTAQGVSNPAPGEGGSAGQTVSDILVLGPRTMRHRFRSISCEDYEDLAREASPGIAAARAFAARQPNGRPAPGWVTVVIVPQSVDARPQPSFELCQTVQSYLAARAPASVAGIAVIGPTYFPVGVDVSFAPVNIESAAPTAAAMAAALNAFLQPLTGGPSGAGWPFGRGVYVSDIARIVTGIAGVDYVASLQLLSNGWPVGDFVAVPGDQIVAAGPLNIVPLAGGN